MAVFYCCLFFFFQLEALFSLKNAWLPQFSFWIARALAKFDFLRMVLNRAKVCIKS